jgi:hypothetical protein
MLDSVLKAAIDFGIEAKEANNPYNTKSFTSYIENKTNFLKELDNLFLKISREI